MHTMPPGPVRWPQWDLTPLRWHLRLHSRVGDPARTALGFGRWGPPLVNAHLQQSLVDCASCGALRRQIWM